MRVFLGEATIHLKEAGKKSKNYGTVRYHKQGKMVPYGTTFMAKIPSFEEVTSQKAQKQAILSKIKC